MYSSRHADSVFLPRRKGTVEVFQVGRVVAPDVDIDHPKFVPVDTQRALRHFFHLFSFSGVVHPTTPAGYGYGTCHDLLPWLPAAAAVG